jgi:hypothetical protein
METSMSPSGAAVISRYGLETGTPALRSIGALAFGPDGILFIADNAGARIVAVSLDEPEGSGTAQPVEIDQIDTRLAAYLGCPREEVFIRAMAVSPSTRQVYLSIMRGTGDDAVPVLVRTDGSGAFAEVALTNVPFAETAITDAPAEDDSRLDARVAQGDREGQVYQLPNGGQLRVVREPLRTVTVTDMAYVDGTLLVAGASNEEFSSTLRRIPFPFGAAGQASSVEIYHVSHGKYETASPIRAFVPYDGGASVLASYTCTPVVHLSLKEMAPGAQIKGRTVAELGAGNTPLDMVAYTRGGEERLLVSNSRHPLFSIACADIDRQEPLTQKAEPAGAPRTTLPLQGVSFMENLDAEQVLMLQLDGDGHQHLHTFSSASL